MSGRPYAAEKERNRELSALDQRERPAVCRALPVKVTLNNTHRCNISCPLCFKQFEPGHNMSYPDMPIQVYRAVAEDLFPAADEVALSVSGEPLISGTIEEELVLGAEYGVRFVITTNGVALSVPRIRELALRHIGVIHLSMDAACKETFERIRDGAEWERVLAGLEACLAERVGLPEPAGIYVNFVMMRENIEELPAWVDRMADLGVDGCCAEHVVVPEVFAVQSLVNHQRLAVQMMERARERAEARGMLLRLPPLYRLDEATATAPIMSREEARERVIGAGEKGCGPECGCSGGEEIEGPAPVPIPTPEEIRAWNSRVLPGGPVLCPYLWRELWVFHDGRVNACDTPTFPQSMGEIPRDRARDVWNGEAYTDLRRRLVAGEAYAACRHCHVMGQIDNPEDPGSFVKET